MGLCCPPHEEAGGEQHINSVVEILYCFHVIIRSTWDAKVGVAGFEGFGGGFAHCDAYVATLSIRLQAGKATQPATKSTQASIQIRRRIRRRLRQNCQSFSDLVVARAVQACYIYVLSGPKDLRNSHKHETLEVLGELSRRPSAPFGCPPACCPRPSPDFGVHGSEQKHVGRSKWRLSGLD